MLKNNIFTEIEKEDITSLPFAEKLKKISKLKPEHLNDIIYNQRMQLIGELASGLVHQLNNTLVGVVGFADILLNRIDEKDENYNHVKTIKNAGEGCQGLLSHLFFFSQRHNPFFSNKTYFVKTDIKNLLDNSLEMITDYLKSKKISLEKNYKKKFPTLGIPVLLEQAFINMLLSSVSNTKNPEIIKVECSRKNENILVTITSSGIMEKEKKSSIPFICMENLESMRLPISYCIIKIHGGMLDIEKEPGDRIVLRVSVPLFS